jgi:hypothetical protein
MTSRNARECRLPYPQITQILCNLWIKNVPPAQLILTAESLTGVGPYFCL